MAHPIRTINVIECRQVHSGTDKNGKAYTIYEVTATTEDGAPIEKKLNSFSNLPTGVGTYEARERDTAKYGKTYTLSTLGAPDDDGRLLQDAVDERYLAADADEVYAEVERELPVIPSTLTDVEREVLLRLYMDFSQRESAEQLGLTRSEMERAVRSIRAKMADWRPSGVAPLAVAA